MRFAVALAAAAALVWADARPPAAGEPTGPPWLPTQANERLAREYAAALNRDRAALDRRPLDWDAALAAVAQWRAEDMAARDYLAHCHPPPVPADAPCSPTIVHQVRELMGWKAAVGENIWSCAAWLRCTAPDVHAAFSGSPLHAYSQRHWLWRAVGVGAAHNRDGHLFVAVLFADRGVD